MFGISFVRKDDTKERHEWESHLLSHSVVWQCCLVIAALLLELHVAKHEHSRDGLEDGCGETK